MLNIIIYYHLLTNIFQDHYFELYLHQRYYNMFEFDQYLGFILFLSVLTMGFWLLILLLTFIVPYWVGGALIERLKEIKNKIKK